MLINKSCDLKDLVDKGLHRFTHVLCNFHEDLIIGGAFSFSHHSQAPGTGLVLVDDLGVESLELFFFEQIHSKSATIHVGILLSM